MQLFPDIKIKDNTIRHYYHYYYSYQVTHLKVPVKTG